MRPPLRLSRIGYMIAILLLVLSAFASPPPVYAQGSAVPFYNKLEAYGQFINLGNTYYGTISSSSGLGVQKDTATNTTKLTLSTAALNYTIGNIQFGDYPPVVNVDSFTLDNVTGKGNFNIVAQGLLCTGSPTVTVTPQMSLNGVNGWVQIPGTTVQTVVPTSLTDASGSTVSWLLNDKPANYIRLVMLGTGSSTTSWQSYWYFHSNFNYLSNTTGP